MAQDLKDTLQLPKTDFPMRANLVQREPSRLAHWEKLDLYAAIQRKNAATGKTFVLHDGPPFTNGDVHIGTALNKTLKDITLRYKSLRGFRTPYVPGWDCHGLPIEQKVMRGLQAENKQVSTAEMRSLCDAFSEGWIATQTKQFKRLGVLADWKNEYKTKAPAYEADIIRTFSSFVGKDLVYRSKKPVYWSIPFETALAEAEIEYKDHVSIAIWVKFNIPKLSEGGIPTSIVIWTTTPWTIPANVAVAIHPKLEYSWVHDPKRNEAFIVATDRVQQFTKDVGITEFKVVQTQPGDRLANYPEFGFGHIARHPLIDRDVPLVLADYVTTETGTGAVHTAPGHGAEDYLTGLRYKLDIYCPVGADGRYLDDGQVPADLVGLSTLETVEDVAAKKPSPANLAVLKKLAAAGALLAKAKYVHSYPHCWRSKTPIIFRAVDQWFVRLDGKGPNEMLSPRERAMDHIQQAVQWIPAWGESRISGAVESRPDWCISRQRSWGVPIIAFYAADKKPFIDPGVIRAVADKIATKGTNFWYDASPAEILDGVTLPAGWPAPAALTCGRDTLDVWIDSGSSHAAVLRNHQGATSWPADLYLEGSDQHRGWFQSSLWTSIIAFDAAPYKAVLTHGFIVGEDGKKISKSGSYEKPPTSDNYIAQYGADVIRFWIASQDFTQDITLSDKILNNAAEGYRNLRNTLRYQLSTLWDFNPATDALPYEQLDTLDRWALHQTAKLLAEATAAYDAYEYHRVIQAVSSFCATTLSAVYHDILKDRLYTLGTANPLRRSSQTAIHHIFGVLVKILAPVLTFTADEAWAFATAKTEYAADSIHLQDWPVAPDEWHNRELDHEMAVLFLVRSKVQEAIEPLRASGKIGKSLDSIITISCPSNDMAGGLLEKHRDFLAELFIVSHVTIQEGTNPTFEVSVRHGEELGSTRCPRCWRWVPALESTEHGETCPRCAEALRT